VPVSSRPYWHFLKMKTVLKVCVCRSSRPYWHFLQMAKSVPVLLPTYFIKQLRTQHTIRGSFHVVKDESHRPDQVSSSKGRITSTWSDFKQVRSHHTIRINFQTVKATLFEQFSSSSGHTTQNGLVFKQLKPHHTI